MACLTFYTGVEVTGINPVGYTLRMSYICATCEHCTHDCSSKCTDNIHAQIYPDLYITAHVQVTGQIVL